MAAPPGWLRAGSGRRRLVWGSAALVCVVLLVGSLLGSVAAADDPGRIAVVDVSADGPVETDGSLVVRVALENDGDRTRSGSVRLVVGDQVDERTVRLSPGERRTVGLRWTPAPNDAGVRSVRVVTPTDEGATTVTVVDEFVADCRRLDDAGVYALSRDLQAGGRSVCLDVVADGVALLGQEHTVVGNGSGGTGVKVRSTAADALVRDVATRDLTEGLRITADGARLRNVSARSNGGSGVVADGVRGLSLTEVRAVDNRAGVVVRRSDGATVADVTARNNTQSGLVVADSDDVTLRNLRLSDNYDGLSVAGGADRLLVRDATVTGNAHHGLTTGGTPSEDGRLVDVGFSDNGGVAVDAGAAVELSGTRVDLGGAAMSFRATRAGIGRTSAARLPRLPNGHEPASWGIDVEIESGGRVDLEIQYDGASGSQASESSVGAWQYDGTAWTDLEPEVDVRDATLAATVERSGVVVATARRNDPPRPAVVASTSTPEVGQPVTFDASASTDPGSGEVAGYAWDLDGDGAVDRRTTDPRTTHTYATPGNRTVELRVTDTDGATAAATVRIRVNEPATPTPTATPDGDDEASRTAPRRPAGWVTPMGSDAPVGTPSAPGASSNVLGDAVVVTALLLVLSVLSAVDLRDRRN